MKQSGKFLFCLWLGSFLWWGFARPTQAYEPADDCIINEFNSAISVNSDASLRILEELKVDCFDLPGKHGIFRILPTFFQRDQADPNLYIQLGSLTDENGKAYPYQTSSNKKTVSWKIGDPDQTIQGLHTYKIFYTVENALDLSDPKNPTLLWNLNGNYWELAIRKYRATIQFPAGVKLGNTPITLFSGPSGSQNNPLASYTWTDENTLVVTSTSLLSPFEGITVKAVMNPQFIRYRLNYFQAYGHYLWYLLSLITLLLGLRLWRKYGDDPSLPAVDMVNYSPPEDLRPLELGLLDTFGRHNTQYLTATIVDLAVRGYLKIEEIEGERKLLGLAAGKKDLLFHQLKKSREGLKPFEKKFLSLLFGLYIEGAEAKTVLLSDLKDKLPGQKEAIFEVTYQSLLEKGLIDKSSERFRQAFYAAAVGIFLLAVVISFLSSPSLSFFISFGITLGLLILFGWLMPRRSQKGVELKYQLNGFKQYLEKAETLRMRFYEKENIFEKYLPYAVAFGLTRKWIQAMKKVYGDEYMTNYYPVWYLGNFAQGGFDIDAFSTRMESLASQVAASSQTSSSGGGGFSGGGGGGGGGGSW